VIPQAQADGEGPLAPLIGKGFKGRELDEVDFFAADAASSDRVQSKQVQEAFLPRAQGYTGIPLMSARKDETAVWYY
jgi:hypothetical protein